MIDRALWAAGITLAAGVLLAGLSGCDTETASGTTSTAPAPRGRPNTATGPDTAPNLGMPTPIAAGQVRVTGMVFSARGEGADPDRPFERGTVVAIPLERFMSIQNALKPRLALGQYLQRSLALPRRLLQEDGVGSGDLGADGTYSLTVRPGPHAFCLVELGGKRPEETAADKFWIERWIEVTVTEDELQAVLPVYNRTTGEVSVMR
jgi:hypothetical protein